MNKILTSCVILLMMVACGPSKEEKEIRKIIEREKIKEIIAKERAVFSIMLEKQITYRVLV